VKNRDQRRPVISFQADRELVHRIDSLCAKENDSRNRVLGRVLENALRASANNRPSVHTPLKKSEKDGQDAAWLWSALVLIAAVIFGPQIIRK